MSLINPISSQTPIAIIGIGCRLPGGINSTDSFWQILKDGKDVIGNIIKCKAFKSRFTKENSIVATRLFYDERGLDSYYGLLELGEKYGIFTKVGNRYQIGEAKIYPKNILEDPQKFFTPEVMQALDECAKKEYSYGSFDGVN